MKDLIARILLSAANRMWQREPTLGNYTAETAEHELNLAFHFAAEIRFWFPWLDCDFDVTKPNFDSNRPDIILHRRREHVLNFLVVEIKRKRNRDEAPEDLKKIRRKWFQSPLLYRFGASLLLDEDRQQADVTVLSRSQPREANPLRLAKIKPIPLPPSLSVTGRKIFQGISNRLAAEQNEQAQRKLLAEIDAKVFEFYRERKRTAHSAMKRKFA